MRQADFELLKQWCDRLISLQVTGTGVRQLDGGILCPACKHMHGRSPDAIFPLMRLADWTGEEKYLRAARALFAWQENFLTDEGCVYNDANSEWRCITVFSAIALYEALFHHGKLLEEGERAGWEERLRRMGDWLFQNLDEHYPANINYPATNAAAMALLGGYFHREDYLGQARHLADYAMAHFTEAGFLRGEGRPREGKSERGCYPVDIGYNVEESVPSLVKCALALGDESMLSQLRKILLQQLNYFLPDGAWNNSFGSRNNKWTYWGSRTSDGCQGAYALLARWDPRFGEAARRNADLLRRCTHEGLLYGGPQYWEMGEPPCVHHTFCHANALALALGEEAYGDGPAVELPCDGDALSLAHDADVDTWRVACGPWRATVTAYDFALEAGHASGGTLSLLWHRAAGPVLLSSVLDYRLAEPLNMQLPLLRRRHRPLTPRVECWREGARFSPCYDPHAAVEARQEGDGVRFEVTAQLVSLARKALARGAYVSLTYLIRPDSVTIEGRLHGEDAADAVFILPVIAPEARVEVPEGTPTPETIFFLTGGFSAREYRITPDSQGRFRAAIRV